MFFIPEQRYSVRLPFNGEDSFALMLRVSCERKKTTN